MASVISGASLAARDSGALMRDLRQTLVDLQRQMATGQKSETYGGLGVGRRTSLDIHARLSVIDGYSSAITSATLRVTIMDQNLTQIGKIVSDARGAARAGSYEPIANGRAIAQVTADDQLKMAIDLLNADMGGTYLFSGRSSDRKPVATYDEIMNGSGGRVGLRQMIAERMTADLGVGGLGRLAVPTLAGSTVTLERDGANPGPFGFAIADISTTSTNVTLGAPAGALQTTTATFAAQPNAGETITVTLALPDGSREDVTLTASTTAATPMPDGTFLVGATPAATAANFRAALQTSMQKAAETSLKSASAITASQAFFAGSSSSPPMRVPAPAASATALVAGTAANTVVWYRGDDDTTAFPNARSTALAKIGDTQTAQVGARANEDALRRVFSFLGAMSATDVAPSDANGRDRYEELADRLRQGLAFPGGVQSVAAIQIELSASIAAIGAAKERHAATKGLLTDSLAKTEGADSQEVAASILALQTRLQATYATTARLAELSLTNYLT